MNKSMLIGLVAIALVILGAGYMYMNQTASSVVGVNVESKGLVFNPGEIRVKQGQTVKINYTNTMGNHDWVVDEFNARTPVIGVGETASVTFVADKTGIFEFYCSVPGHRQAGMKGNLIVE